VSVCGGSRAHVEVLAQTAKKPKRARILISNSRCSRAQINKLTTLHRRNMTFVISNKSQNSNPTRFRQRAKIVHSQQKGLFLTSFYNSLKVSSALSAPLLTLSTSFNEEKVPYKKKKKDNLFAIGTPQNDLPLRKTAMCRPNKILDIASQVSMERTSL